MPLPDVLAGVDWKTAAFEGLASQFLNTLPTLGGLEIHQMMRALVRRLNQSEADLAVALKLAEGGAQSPVSQLMVTLLGRIQSEAAVDLLAKLAGGGQTAGRELAVWSLAQSGQEPYLDSDPALLAKNPRGILSEPAYAIRGRHAAVMLARLAGESDPDVLSSLIAIFSDAQAEPRSSSPPRHETDREAITRLTIGYALNNKDARVRHSALAALGGTKAEAAIAALAQAMTTDEVASNRARAALSLSNLPGNETILRAARTAGADPDETVREFAVGLLHGARWVGRENEVLGVVEEIYRRDASARVRWECVGKFGSFGTAGRLLLQDAASNDPDPEVRKLAVELLSRSP
ncbi:MAG: hypothetical protein HYY17_04780 [Planctomycetes bacterium]|nr:hypothetical protein [Planctomycetota bacterium]